MELKPWFARKSIMGDRPSCYRHGHAGMSGSRIGATAAAGESGLGVIYMSGYSEQAAAEATKSAASAAILTKPFSRTAICARCAKYFRTKTKNYARLCPRIRPVLAGVGANPCAVERRARLESPRRHFPRGP